MSEIVVERVAVGALPLSLRRARLQWQDKVAWGYGESLSAVVAGKKAVSEAWERLALQLQAEHTAGISSNGFAASADLNVAQELAMKELKERRILQAAWQQQTGWFVWKLRALVPMILVHSLHRRAWQVDFFVIRDGSGHNVLTGLLRCKKRGALFDSVYMEAGAEASAEKKLCLSLLRAAALCQDVRVSEGALRWKGAPLDHYYFYRNPSNLKAFAFLDKLPRLQLLLNALEGSNWLRTDIVLEGPGIFVARAQNVAWQPFVWGMQSIGGRNPWPHPLA